MKKFLASVLIFFYLAIFLTEEPLLAMPPFEVSASISAQSAILLDPSTNRVLFAKKPNYERPAASTTKLMTALVAMDSVSLNRVIRVPRSAEYILPSNIRLRMGERFYAKDLLKALLIASANDAAHTLAIAVVGSEARFAELMNARARKIGCRHTHFTNASGLPSPAGQYTTAYDLALIMKEARKIRSIDQILAKRVAVIKALTGRRVFLKNHNRMLWKRSHTVEGKTGFTRSALHCFVGKIHGTKRGDILVAIMGSLRLWHDLAVLVGMTHRFDPFQKSFNRVNLSHKEVAEVQRCLWRAGFPPGLVNGIFGTKTLRALKKFQRSRGIEPDGIVGSKTWAKLKSV